MQYIINSDMLETFKNCLEQLRIYACIEGNRKKAQLIDNVLEELEKLEEIS